MMDTCTGQDPASPSELFLRSDSLISPTAINYDEVASSRRRRKSNLALLEDAYDDLSPGGMRVGDLTDAPLIQFALRGMDECVASAHVNPARSHERSIKQLRNLASKSPENKRMILEKNTLETILQSMRQYPYAAELQDHACALLADLVDGNEHSKKDLVSHGGLVFIIGSLLEDDAASAPIAQALNLLGVLATGSQGMQRTIAELGGVGIGVSMLGRPDLDVKLKATFLLEHLVFGHRANQDLVGELKGLPQLLDELRQFPDSVPLVCQVARTLGALVTENERLCEQVGLHGGIESLVTVMTNHSKIAQVQHDVCTAFRFLAFSEENRFRIGDKGAILLIVKALVEVQKNPVYVLNALLSLSNATFDLAQNIYVAGISGGVDATVCIMKLYPDDPDILEAGCRVLRNLADWLATACEQLIQDTIETVLNAMDSQFMRAGVQEHACAMLLNLLQQDVTKVIQARTEVLVDRCIESYCDSEEIRSQALQLHHLIQQSKYQRSKSRAPLVRLFSSRRTNHRELNDSSDIEFDNS